MKKMEYMLGEEVNKLEKIITQAKKRVQEAPEGFLRTARKGDDVEYYHKYKGTNNVNGKYIKKDDIGIASSGGIT